MSGQVTPLPRELPTLTVLRAVAALLVFAFHVDVSLMHLPLASVGYVGVGFFFILSGFVLTWSYRPERTWGDFFVRRVARIFPSHLVALALAVVVMVAVLHIPVTAGQVIPQVLLVQAWLPDRDTILSVNQVSWSLSVEMAFYVLFPFLMPWLLRLRGGARWAVVGGLLLVPVLVGILLTSVGLGQLVPFLYFNPLARLPEFLIGVALALGMRAGWRPRVPLWAVAVSVVAAWVACSVAGAPEYIGDAALAVPLALMIAKAAERDIAVRSTRMPRWMVFAGQASFAFYLVHYLVMNVVGHTVRVPAGIQALLSLAFAVVLAVLVHTLVELPAQRGIVRLWRAVSPPRVIAPATEGSLSRAGTARQAAASASAGQPLDKQKRRLP